mgnify:CR=1 FL=1
MNLRFLKLGLGVIFGVSLASLGVIFLFINPNRTNVFSLALFSVVALILFFSIFSWMGFWFRRKYITERNSDRILKMVFREGGLAAFLGMAGVWLSHFNFLKIWTILPLFVLTVGIEYYFLTRQ